MIFYEEISVVDACIWCKTVIQTEINGLTNWRGKKMADLFSNEWMKSFMEQWNAEPELSDALAKINFSSVIAYGFDGEDTPRGVLTVENGKAVSAGIYNGEELSWDIRATFDNWNKWLASQERKILEDKIDSITGKSSEYSKYVQLGN